MQGFQPGNTSALSQRGKNRWGKSINDTGRSELLMEGSLRRRASWQPSCFIS